MRRLPIYLTLLFSVSAAHGQTAASPKIVERYKAIIEANPADGAACERLWKIYADEGKTAELLNEYAAGTAFSQKMVHGHFLRRAGRLDEATAAYQRAAQLDPASPLPFLALAHLDEERGKPRNAAAWSEKALGLIAPTDPRAADLLIHLGTEWLGAGEPALAVESWEKAAAANPSDLGLRRKLAEACERDGLLDRAVGHFAYLVAHSPPNEQPGLLQEMARLQRGAGHRDAALASLERALALTGPGNWLREELESQIIRLSEREHHITDLEERWRKLAEENPRDLGSWLRLVHLYECLGDLPGERAALLKLTALAPKKTEYRAKLARLLVQSDLPKQAEEVYDGLLKEQPANVDWVFERARLDLQDDAAVAARRRISALVDVRKSDESVRAKALAFYQQNRLFDYVEEQLCEDAGGESPEAISALASFYFAQRRDGEARGVLRRLVRASDPVAQQARAHLRIAQLLKAQNDFEHAAEHLQEAVKLEPQNADYHLALGEVHAVRGDAAHAQEDFENALRWSKSEADREVCDQKLFESFRGQAFSGGIQTLPPGFTSSGAESGQMEANPRLELFLSRLERDARQLKTTAAWLRLARWRMWNRDLKGALAATQKALTADAPGVSAYEMLITLQTANGPSAGAVETLGQLARLDPENRTKYDRRAGQLELQSGRLPEALAIFEGLVAENPGNMDLLADLAEAQQRSDDWRQALATWKKIYELSPVSRRRQVLTSLLHAMDRLGQHRAAAEFQLKELDTEPDTRERTSRFHDLLVDCAKNDLLGWLREQFESRRKIRADDYFTEISYGQILKAMGDAAGAFDVLSNATYSAPNEVEALPELVHEAEELHKLDAAIKLQEELLRIAPAETLEGFQRLVQLQVKNFQVEAAFQTWDRILTKFPRDAAALSGVSDFLLSWGKPERAVALLRRSRMVDRTNLHTLSTLAALDVGAGELVEARDCLDQILRLTAPEKPGDLIHFPAVKFMEAGRLQMGYLATVAARKGEAAPETMRALRSFWVDEASEKTGPENSREIRFNAIRHLAELVAGGGDGTQRAAWRERWRNETAPAGEALWALFYSGETVAMLDRLQALMHEQPSDPRLVQAFIWLSLQTRQFQPLGSWLANQRRTLSERDYFMVALGQELDGASAKIDPEMISTLFAAGTPLRRWQAAMLFAAHRRFREAVTLGQSAFDHSTARRPTYARELANWYLLLGDAPQALAVLSKTISSAADSLAAPACAALRAYYLLLPGDQRGAFVTSYLAHLDFRENPLHGILANVLLHGLSGEEDAARLDLDRLIDMRPLADLTEEKSTAGKRRLEFVLELGTQLQALQMDDLAVYYWEKALSDSALVALEGDAAGNLAREIRQRLCILHAATEPSGKWEPWLERYALLSPGDGLAPLANALAAMGVHGRAIEVYRQICEHDPGDTEALRNLLSECRAAGDNDTAETALRGVLRDGGSRLADGARREFYLDFADILERQSNVDRACAVLAGAIENTPNDTRLLLRWGQLQERALHPEQAIDTYQRLLITEPSDLAARLALSALYESCGRVKDAVTLFQGRTTPDDESHLVLLQCRANDPEAALTTLDRILPPQHMAAALGAASAFVAQGDNAHARAAIQAALARTSDPRLCFPLDCKMIELLTLDDGPAIARRELRRLRQFSSAGEDPGLLATYLDFAAGQAVRLRVQSDFLAEVTALWANGSGPLPAGVAAFVALSESQNRSAANAILDQLLLREGTGDALLQSAADYLKKTGQFEALARIQERLAQTNPLNEDLAIDLARTLMQLGRHVEARSTLENLATRASLNEDLLGKVAAAFRDCGDMARARSLFAEAARRDRFARNWGVLLDYAQLQTTLRDFDGAKATLRTAFAVPANQDYDGIVRWMVAAGKIKHADVEAAQFDLIPPRRDKLLRSVFSHCEQIGDAEGALALAEKHPALLLPGYCGHLRKVAALSGEFARGAKILAELAAQAESAGACSLELALLRADWARVQLAAGEFEKAASNLKLAQQEHPELFEIAARLSSLLQERGDHGGAVEALQRFLAVARNPREIEQARALLAGLGSGR